LRLVSEPRQPVAVGISIDEADTAHLKLAGVRPNSPAAEAGWEAGDKVLSIGGVRITPTSFLKIVGRYKPGDRVNATLQRGGRTIQTTIIMGEPQLMNYRIEEIANASSTAKALRAAWLNGR
jgi:predicted metalloprotease with PDZ domain